MLIVKRALVLGGYGGFGARLSARLAQDGWTVIVAGRDGSKAQALAKTLPGATGAAVDRSGDLAAVLALLKPDLLVDAAGPFQGSDYRVAEASIAARIPYLDLADGRDFVCGIGALDEQARTAGIPVISGASSVPALSGAVLRELTAGMDEVRSVRMSISASNRATAGRSVAQAILSYAGKPIDLWAGRRWTTGFGLQPTRRETYAVAGRKPLRRRVGLADVPDHDIVPSDLPGMPATRFEAGPEFAFQLLGLWLLSWPVRWGWLRSLSGFAPLLLPLQRITGFAGTARSAMTVEAKGVAQDDMQIARWTLIADKGHGPEIPVLAAQLLARRIAAGKLPAGARDASGILSLADFEPLFAQLAIKHVAIYQPYIPLYRRIMGASFGELPPAVRAMHEVIGDGGAQGRASVTRGKSPLAPLVCAIMRFPTAGEHELHVAFDEGGGVERWTRAFGRHHFTSELRQRGRELIERFGPMRFRFILPVDEHGLQMLMRGWSIFGVPLPLALAPRSLAREWEQDGRFHFEVPIALPLIGPIVHYRGWLEPL